MRLLLSLGLAFGMLAPWITMALPPTPDERAALVPRREVRGRTIRSSFDPAIRLEFSDRYSYAGGQRFVLYDVADAEQHFFVDAGPDGVLRSFFWVQFEQFLPGKGEGYTYAPLRLTRIGSLDFITDTKVFADYGKTVMNPESLNGSDQSRAGVLLRAKGYRLPAAAVRARMFYLPDESRRKELMIIYVESLAPSDSPRELPVESPADEKFPEIARRATENAAKGLTIAPR
jgi:hypothetical protein